MNHAKGIFIRAFILAILLLPFMLAANLCRPKFIESLHMQVVDADGYAIPNVSISLRYQRSATVYVYENGRYVPDYRTTNPVYTDWRGQANVTVVNTESDSSKLDCNIQVTLEYFGKKYYHTISLKDVPPDYFTFTLSDVRRVHVRVLDEGRAVPSFKLYVSARGTDASWSVNGNEFYVELPEGSIQGYVYNPAKDLKMFFSEYVNKDYGGLLIDFRRVPLTIKVSDDLGMPLPFTVIVDGKSYFGAKNGVNISLYDKPINATLLVNGTEMAITLNPKLGEQSYYIDRHSPYLVNTRHDRSDKRGLSLEIVVKKGYNPDNILHKLYDHTALKTTFSIISIALVDGKPKMLPLYSLLNEFLRFREETVKRRTQYRLRKAEKRAHIIEGLLKALSKIDKTVALLKSAKDVKDAKEQLKTLLEIDDEQAQAILDMKLQKIVSLERDKLTSEFEALQKDISALREILESRERLLEVIKNELIEIRDKYGDDRRTEIIEDYSQQDVDEPTIVVYTEGGYIKRVHPSVVKAQNRGGVGIRLTSTDQRVRDILTTSTAKEILVFTTKGKVHKVPVYKLPILDRYAKGMYIGNFVKLDEGEEPVTIARYRTEGYIIMATKKGLVKRVSMDAFAHIRAGGIRAISFKGDDSLADVAYSDGKEDIFVATKKGKSILFPQGQIRETGRASMGVRAIKLSGDDIVVNVSSIRGGGAILTITNTGYGRFTRVEDYRVQNRGGSGIINIRLKQGEHVVFSRYVLDNSEFLLTSVKGMVIKIIASQIPQYGRNSRGVRLMRLKDDELASVAVVL